MTAPSAIAERDAILAAVDECQERMLARLEAARGEVECLVRERGWQRPPAPVPSLREMAGRRGTTAEVAR